MHRQLKIFVDGGFPKEEVEAETMDNIVEFGKCLGREIIEQGHILLNRCQTELDKHLALAALAAVPGTEVEGDRIISYLPPKDPNGTTRVRPIHECGRTCHSSTGNWDNTSPDARPPELVAHADVVVLVGGDRATIQAANWAVQTKTPVLPFYSFMGAAQKVYVSASKSYPVAQEHADEFEKVLAAVTNDWDSLAKQTVNLAERVVTPKKVFLVMSFSEDSHFKNLENSIKKVCNDSDYDAEKVSDSSKVKRILPQIEELIRDAAFVIADVTDPKPNVYYEIGLSRGFRKPIILTARQGTELPFDINDHPVIEWEVFSEFEQKLHEAVQEIAEFQGRPKEAPLASWTDG